MLPLTGCFPENYLSPSPAHGVPGSLFTWTRDRYASYVWNASILLADKIAAKEIDVAGKRVLELGAGLGLPGLVAARMGAELVVLTDYDQKDALDDTARAVDEALSPELQHRVHVFPHTWGRSVEPLLRISPSFDLLLVADCVWSPALHGSLVKSLVSLLAACPSATVHFAAGFHTGRKAVAAFLAAAEQAGVTPRDRADWVEVSVEGEVRAWNWGRVDCLRDGREVKVCGPEPLEEEKQEERNRWTLYGALGLQGAGS